LLFSGDRGGHIGVVFDIDERVAVVFCGEAGGAVFAVLGGAFEEVGGDADVEGAVAGAWGGG
jgi:hypothetical protein